MAQSNQSARAVESVKKNQTKRRSASTVFDVRLAARKDELEQFFMSLYSDHDAFDALVASMAEAYAEHRSSGTSTTAIPRYSWP